MGVSFVDDLMALGPGIELSIELFCLSLCLLVFNLILAVIILP